jgi:hypothetical protein
MTLDDIALRYGTDKASSGHNYTPLYEQFLGSRRDEPLRLLELGIGGHEDPQRGGASLRMWRDYLPNAHIVGLDAEPKAFLIDGVTMWTAGQDDRDVLDVLAHIHGPFDVIVDDCSHLSSKTIASFKALYPHLAAGGLYVVEDLHTSYHDWYYGPEDSNPIPGCDAMTGPTTMQFLKRLADEVQFNPAAPPRSNGKSGSFEPQHWLGYHLASVAFFPDICFVTKARP